MNRISRMQDEFNRFERRQNVVLVTVDSLRADHCGFMGAPWDTTPTLDRLANEGVVFENAIATGPRTPSSMPVAFTGRFPEPVDLAWGDWERRYGRISNHLRRHLTLPERMKRAGYSTVGITVNPWTHRTAFQKGFDRFEEITAKMLTQDGKMNASLVSTLDTIFDKFGFRWDGQWQLTKDWFVQWTHFYDLILDAMEDTPEPYFLWVFLLDPHQPYLAPRRYRKENTVVGMYLSNYREMTGDESYGNLAGPLRTRLKRAYRDAIRSTDGFVEQLRGDLPGVPTFILHSDHGEAMGEHDNWGHPSALYEENLHVPLLVHDGVSSGRVDAPFSLQQLPELVLKAASGNPIDSTVCDGDFVMATTETGDRFSLRGRRWKYLIGQNMDELYDLQTDPKETHELGAEAQDVTSLMRQLLAHKRHHNDELVSIGRSAETVPEVNR